MSITVVMEKENIEKYYETFNEDLRLKSAYGRLEEEHIRRVLLKNIPYKTSIVFDIGGGTGHYSRWLAESGYQVHYSDVVPKHVQLFNERHRGLEGIVTSSVQDARNLSYDDCCADIVILNGPLYHLTEKDNRIKALRESKRILRRGGKLLAVTIGRLAGLQYALSSGMIFDDDYYSMVATEVATGIRKNKSSKLSTFDIAYFHTVQEINTEMRESGFSVLSTLGLVGLSGISPMLESDMEDEHKRERLLSAAELTEMYPVLSPKMMTIGIKNR